MPPYKRIGITAFLVIAASMLFAFLLFRGSTFFAGIQKFFEVVNPIVYGFVIAYILDPQMTFFESLIYTVIGKTKWKPQKKGKQTIRIISAIFAVLFAIWIVYELLALVVPELINSIRNIILNIPIYQRNINNFIDQYFSGNEIVDERTTELINNAIAQLQTWINDTATPQLNQLAGSLTSQIFDFVTFLKNIFLGLIVSIYVLISKESMVARLRRFIYAIFKIPTANRILSNLRFIDEKFGGFIIGKVIDSVIIGIICYVVLKVMGMPFTMLISVVIGVTNIIPFFGPFIGAVPAAVLIFVVNPIQALYFIIFIIILQQIDGNLLGPRILGSSVGVSSFMVIVAILIGSGFFGVLGMIIGVPLSAILTAVLEGFIMRQMAKKKLPGDLETYHYVDNINVKTKEIINESTERPTKNLYESIKYRSPELRAYDEPLESYPWERTMDEILAEDAQMQGKEYTPSPSEYHIVDDTKAPEENQEAEES